MITEDYVSFEVAKLLVKKGLKYNAEYESYYTIHGKVVFLNDNPTEINIAPRFTIQTAMKWLRKEHNLMVSPYALSLGYYFEIFDLSQRDIIGLIFQIKKIFLLVMNKLVKLQSNIVLKI